MAYWSEQMPRGMLLRSRRRSSHIADPTRSLRIDDYERAKAIELGELIRVEDFVEYGRWFQERVVPDLDTRFVHSIDSDGDRFKLELSEGEPVEAGRVILAAGLDPFPRHPEPLASVPTRLVTHSSEHAEPSGLAGKRVLVVGGGQSALECAALFAEAGAEVEIVVRAPAVRWLRGEKEPDGVRDRVRAALVPPTDVGGKVLGWIAAAPDVCRRLPDGTRTTVRRRTTAPAGSAWLVERLAEVPITTGRSIAAASEKGDGVQITLDDGSTREADHVVLGTGFEVDVSRYGILSDSLLAQLDVAEGFPLLRPGLESSFPRLHFVGAPAARSFGPVMQFVVGAWYAAPVVTRAALDRRQRTVRMAYMPRRGQAARPVARDEAP
jgi:cation diffusion facilitator CzcD-associated flavoprotein CzcO